MPSRNTFLYYSCRHSPWRRDNFTLIVLFFLGATNVRAVKLTISTVALGLAAGWMQPALAQEAAPSSPPPAATAEEPIELPGLIVEETADEGEGADSDGTEARQPRTPRSHDEDTPKQPEPESDTEPSADESEEDPTTQPSGDDN